MNCPKCNTSVPDGAAFCSQCGAEIAQSVQQEQPTQQQPTQYQPPVTEQHVSVGAWVGRSLINLIPCVGGIIYIIMLFVWSGDTKYNETSRNWAKAQLILLLIGVVLCFAIFIINAALGNIITNYIMDSYY